MAEAGGQGLGVVSGRAGSSPRFSSRFPGNCLVLVVAAKSSSCAWTLPGWEQGGSHDGPLPHHSIPIPPPTLSPLESQEAAARETAPAICTEERNDGVLSPRIKI